MNSKHYYTPIEKLSAQFETKENRFTKGLESQTRALTGKNDSNLWLKPDHAGKPRILIVSDDDSISKDLEMFLLHAGFTSERVRSMKAACESARLGLFQVVVTAPALRDGSWKQLAYINNRHRPGFVIILVATSFDLNEWGQALEDGAFDVLDALHGLPQVAEVARGALWAAYLKGAGPRPETASLVSAD